jgi:hypothetical protein
MNHANQMDEIRCDDEKEGILEVVVSGECCGTSLGSLSSLPAMKHDLL